MKFIEEGKYYFFEVVNELSFSKKENYFILKDIFKRKHLLNKKFYMNYKIEIGKKIECKVDKINCQGRVFLEPKNPFYNIGDFGNFNFIEKKIEYNSKGKVKYNIYFFDKYKNKVILQCDLTQFLNFDQNNIRAVIVKFKKANIYIKF